MMNYELRIMVKAYSSNIVEKFSFLPNSLFLILKKLVTSIAHADIYQFCYNASMALAEATPTVQRKPDVTTTPLFDKEVGMWHVAQATNGETIGTRTLGSCIGLIIVKQSEQLMITGHFPQPADAKKTISSFPADKSTLEVYLGGVSPYKNDLPERIAKKRAEVVQMLEDAGFTREQIHEYWANQGESTVMWGNSATGEVFYKTEARNH
jgi:hypothetical protein